MTIAKIIEVVGASEKSWEEAAQNAIKRSSDTVRNIKGIDVIKQTAKVENGSIKEYRTTIKIAFSVE